MPHEFTTEQRIKGGKNSKRGKGKKTIARELLEQVAGDNDSRRSLELLSQALAGRQGSALQVELIKALFAASLDVAGQKDVSKFKAQLRNRELVLAAILRQSNQKQALELYKSLSSETEDDEQEDPAQ
ncbi:hypothetical protein [Shewanella chilikensis]|uniref:hypothetical protein n=1 Tax=Shewanella chilikensis TaxID=558541 RepID=UPI003999CCE8